MSIRSELGKRNMEESVEGLVRGSEVPLRAFCCKARGGGGRLRHATVREKKEKKQEKEVTILKL